MTCAARRIHRWGWSVALVACGGHHDPAPTPSIVTRPPQLASEAPPAPVTPPTPWHVAFVRAIDDSYATVRLAPDDREVLLGGSVRFDLSDGHYVDTVRVPLIHAWLEGDRVLAAPPGTTLEIRDVRDAHGAPLASVDVDTDALHVLNVSRDGRFVATEEIRYAHGGDAASAEVTYRVRAVPSFESAGTIPRPDVDEDALRILGFSGDDQLVALQRLSADREPRASQLVRYTLEGHGTPLGPPVVGEDVALSRGGTCVVLRSGARALEAFDVATGSPRGTSPVTAPSEATEVDAVDGLAVSDDCTRVAWFGSGVLHVVARGTGGAWAEAWRGEMLLPSGLAFTHDGATLVTGGTMRVLREGAAAATAASVPAGVYTASAPPGYERDAVHAPGPNEVAAYARRSREPYEVFVTVSAYDLAEFRTTPSEPEAWGRAIVGRFFPDVDLETPAAMRRARFRVARNAVAERSVEVHDRRVRDVVRVREVHAQEHGGALYVVDIEANGEPSAREIERVHQAFAVSPFASVSASSPSETPR